MRNLLSTTYALFKLGAFFSLALLSPGVVSILTGDGLLGLHLRCGLTSFCLCSLAALLTRPYQKELRPKDGFTLVVWVWVGFSALAAVPLYFGIEAFSPLDAFFEAVSGLTTTGITMAALPDALPPSINFLRHLLNWLGGMGIILLAVAILPMLGVGGMQLFKAETSGIDKSKKLTPRITSTAKSLWSIYVAFTLWTLLALRLAGMTWLDAVCHALASVSLGGFSTHASSVAFFDSPLIELILMCAMLSGFISFTTHYHALTGRSFKPYWQNLEVRVSSALLFGSILFVSLALWLNGTYGYSERAWADSFRHTAFNYISASLACGFSSYDFGTWPFLGSIWMFILANMICNAGSTGGGVKMIRAIVLFKFMTRELTLLMHPNAVARVKINGQIIPERTALTVSTFVFVYCSFVVLLTFLLVLSGLDPVTSFGFTVSTITNMGLGLGQFAPSGDMTTITALQKCLGIFSMLLGRLEIFPVLMILTPGYWRN